MHAALRFGAVPVAPRAQIDGIADFDKTQPLLVITRRLREHSDKAVQRAAMRAESDHHLLRGALPEARAAVQHDPARVALLDILDGDDTVELRDFLKYVSNLDGAILRVFQAWATPFDADAEILLDQGMEMARLIGPHVAAHLGLVASMCHERRGESEQAFLEVLRSLTAARRLGDLELTKAADHLFRELRAEPSDAMERLAQATLTVRSDLEGGALPKLAQTVLDLIDGAERAFVLIGDAEHMQVRGAAYRRGFEGAPSIAIAQSCLTEGRPIVAADTEQQLAPNRSGVLPPRMVLCLPLDDGERTHGVLYIDSTTASDIDLIQQQPLMRNFAAHAAVVLHGDFLLDQATDKAEHARWVAHDLRKLIGAMSTAIQERIDKLPGNPPTALVAVQQITSVVDSSLMELAEGEPEPFRPVMMDRIVDETLDLLVYKARAEGVTLLKSTAPLWVSGNPAKLQRLLINLVDNAIKYTPGGEHVVVELTTRDDQVALTVADRGPGVARSHVRSIFEPGVQGPNALPGHGMGLAICKRIVEAHGGSITARNRSSPGGLAVTARLPPLPQSDA